MLSKRLLPVLAFSLMPLAACADKSQPSVKVAQKSAENKEGTLNQVKTIKRGVKIPKDADCLSLDTIADKPEKFSNVEVVVEGEIKAVCQAKGCWMTMGGDKSTSRARVTFKDYAFFVPKDVKGKQVKLKGQVKVKLLGDAERAHLAEDGRVSISEIPKAELRLVASGVEIR